MRTFLDMADLLLSQVEGQGFPRLSRKIEGVVYNNLIALAMLAATSLVAVSFAYIYSLNGSPYLLL